MLRWRSLIAACGFGTFGCFWTTVTFLLAASYVPIGLAGAHLGSLGLALHPEARSRLTTVYITTMFAGGAVGSAAGAQAYAHWGWGCCSGPLPDGTNPRTVIPNGSPVTPDRQGGWDLSVAQPLLVS